MGSTALTNLVLPDFNDTTPSAPATGKNAHCQHGSTFVASDGTTRRSDSFYMDNELVIGFGVAAGAGTTGNDAAPRVAAKRAANITECVVTITKSDAANDFQFRIKKNGTDIFSTDPTVPHGSAVSTGPSSVLTFTAFTSTPIVVAKNDVFELDIIAGSATWELDIQLRA